MRAARNIGLQRYWNEDWPYYESDTPPFQQAPNDQTLYACLLAVLRRPSTPAEELRDQSLTPAALSTDLFTWIRIRARWALIWFDADGNPWTHQIAEFNAVLNRVLAVNLSNANPYRAQPNAQPSEWVVTNWEAFKRFFHGGVLRARDTPVGSTFSNREPGQLRYMFDALEPDASIGDTWDQQPEMTETSTETVPATPDYPSHFRTTTNFRTLWKLRRGNGSSPVNQAALAGFGELTRPCGYIGGSAFNGRVFESKRLFVLTSGSVRHAGLAAGTQYVATGGTQQWAGVIRTNWNGGGQPAASFNTYASSWNSTNVVTGFPLGANFDVYDPGPYPVEDGYQSFVIGIDQSDPFHWYITRVIREVDRLLRLESDEEYILRMTARANLISNMTELDLVTP